MRAAIGFYSSLDYRLELETWSKGVADVVSGAKNNVASVRLGETRRGNFFFLLHSPKIATSKIDGRHPAMCVHRTLASESPPVKAKSTPCIHLVCTSCSLHGNTPRVR